jgi:hypothetical protein
MLAATAVRHGPPVETTFLRVEICSRYYFFCGRDVYSVLRSRFFLQINYRAIMDISGICPWLFHDNLNYYYYYATYMMYYMFGDDWSNESGKRFYLLSSDVDSWKLRRKYFSKTFCSIFNNIPCRMAIGFSRVAIIRQCTLEFSLYNPSIH